MQRKLPSGHPWATSIIPMPFRLKNAGATYQRAMTAIFHDMMHKELEDYVDDIVVKSRKRKNTFGC